MNLIALLIGLIVERLATRIFHWRRMRRMDRIIDAGFRAVAGFANWPALIPVVLLELLLAAPVFIVTFALSFRGRSRCNDFSIGIELEGDDDTPYDDRQYDVLGDVLSALLNTYPDITSREIAAHSDISPGRKTDPGPAFDWLRLYDGIR